MWASQDKSATHMTLPAEDARHGRRAGAGHRGMPNSPQEAADLALKAITRLPRSRPAAPPRVAGRSAYELVLTPKDPASLVA